MVTCSSLHVAVGCLAGVTGGPATYADRLVRAIVALPDAPRLSVLTDRPEAFADVGCDVIGLPMRGGVDRLRWQHVALPRAVRRLGCDLYHDTKNALPFALRVPAAVTVHDLAYWRVPETFGFASRLFLKRATGDAVRRARVVVVPSEATARDLHDLLPAARGKVRVVHHGIDPPVPVSAADRERVAHSHRLPERYVLHIGTLQARKNVDLVIRAVRRLRAEGAPHRVVVVGRRGWLADRTLTEIARDDTALWLGTVSAADLAALYAGAEVFCSPSAYEGFGFTVADALAAGVATVISSVSSLPEVCGDAAARIAKLDEAGVADALRPLLFDDAHRRALAARGPARAADFSWRRAAEATCDAWREAVASAR